MNSNFIDLPNGYSIHKDCIKVVRILDPSQDYPQRGPRVVVQYVAANQVFEITQECATIEERDALAAQIKERI